MSRRPVAVVGMAAVFPGAADLGSYWRNIANGVDATSELPAERWPGSRNLDLPADHFAHIGTRRGGFVPTPLWFDALRFKVMPSVARHGDPDQFLLLRIMADALADAGIAADDPRRARTDVIVGRGGYTSNKMMDLFLRADLIDRLHRFLERRLPGVSSDTLDRLVGEMRDSLPQAEADNLATSIPNLVAARAANRLNLRGTAYNVDAACASSLLAVEQATRRLREGASDLAVVCGINFTHIPAFWYLFERILALSPSGVIRPFDRRADGLLIGEGAGAVVLERLEDARRAGSRTYALILGTGSAGDGNAAGVLAPAAEGQVQALARAYADADVDPDTIGLLEAHGTGTAQGDATEIESIVTFFGTRRGGVPSRAMGSVKSMIGHTMPAAGVASLIKTVLALNHKLWPPSLHCEEPRAELEASPFWVNGRARPWLHVPGRAPRRAGVNAFGFGGINAHVVLEEIAAEGRSAVALGAGLAGPAARPVRSEVARPTELLTFSAATPAELAERLRRAARFAGEDRGDLTLESFAAALAREVRHDWPCKLACVVDNLDAVAERLEADAGRLDSGAPPAGTEERGVYYSECAARPRGGIVGLFPGLAFPGLVGRYPAHLIESCLQFPAAREVFDLVERRDEHPDDPVPTSLLLAPPETLPEEQRERLRQRFAAWVGQWLEDPAAGDGPLDAIRPLRADERLLSAMGMLASNHAGWRVLEGFAIPFDMLSGQSLGEISALCAAGSFEFDAAMAKLWPYLGIDPRAADLGCLAVVCAGEERLAPPLARFPDLAIGLYLSPGMSIVGGPDEQVVALIRLLREEGILCQRLPFPPIHTPSLRAKQDEFVALDQDPLPLGPPRCPVYSNLTTGPVKGDPEELRQLVADNLTHPVRFWQTLNRMYADGARIFVQVGSGTLAGKVRNILDAPDVLSVALDVDYRDPVTQLRHLCAALFTAGVPLRLEALFESRVIPALDLDAPREAARPPRGAVPLQLYWPPLVVDEVADAPDLVPGRAPAAAEPRAPLVGSILERTATRLVQVRRFDLEQDRFLADHTFVGPQHGLPLEERFPVLPMTVTLELLAETAAVLAPGLALVGFEQVRGRRWIALDRVPALDVRVEATREGPAERACRVRVDALVADETVASATVVFDDRYRESLDLQFSELSEAAPFPIAVQALYDDHHFFHGPAFHCLADVRARGRHGLVGDLRVTSHAGLLRDWPEPPFLLDPVVLDGVGQLLGAMFFDRGVHILPVAIERIEFYRTRPEVGTVVPVRLEVTDYSHDERRVVASMEVGDGAGGVWFRVRGWQDLVFRYSKALLCAQRLPGEHTLAAACALPGLPADGVATILPREVLRDSRPESIARIYLHAGEWSAFESAGSDARRREWLMGRIAAKDAVRHWLARREGGPFVHPTRLAIENDARGKPCVRFPGYRGALPEISLAHKGAVATAAAAGTPIGIDLEPLEAGRGLDLAQFATDDEIARVREIAGAPAADWTTRLWCGKEAAAKALGTGLGGRPRAFRAVELGADGRLVIQNGDPACRVEVRTSEQDGFTFAVASLPVDVGD